VIRATHEVNIELPQPKPRTSKHQQSNVEIPIIISAKTPPAKPKRAMSPVKSPARPEQIQSRLTDLNRLNLDLDQLISREEKIFELENSKSISTNPLKSAKTTSSPNDESPIILQKHLQSDQPDEEATTGFDLIKVSIVNKRPVSPDLDEIINGSDEETYLDRSLGINDDFNKQYEANNKRLSSLDPSLSYEYEHNVTMRVNNPFSSDINTSFRSQCSSSKHQQQSPALSPIKVSKTNPFRDNLAEIAHSKRHEQLINVEKLNSYKYQYEIHKNQDSTGVVKTKDISVVGVSTPQCRQTCPLHSGSKISVHTDIQVDFNSKNPFRDDVMNMRQQQVAAEARKKKVEVATIESSINQPHVVERRFYSEEELRFKENGADDVVKVAESEAKTEIKILRDKSKDRSKVKTREEPKGKEFKQIYINILFLEMCNCKNTTENVHKISMDRLLIFGLIKSNYVSLIFF